MLGWKWLEIGRFVWLFTFSYSKEGLMTAFQGGGERVRANGRRNVERRARGEPEYVMTGVGRESHLISQ
jgi:hypothetical protein